MHCKCCVCLFLFIYLFLPSFCFILFIVFWWFSFQILLHTHTHFVFPSLSLLLKYIRDPQNAVDFVEALYGDGPFMNSLYNSLTDNGVLLTQVGEAVSVGDISETYPGNFNYQRAQYESGLINQGFEVVMQYDEPRAGFDGIWSFYACLLYTSPSPRDSR